MTEHRLQQRLGKTVRHEVESLSGTLSSTIHLIGHCTISPHTFEAKHHVKLSLQRMLEQSSLVLILDDLNFLLSQLFLIDSLH